MSAPRVLVVDDDRAVVDQLVEELRPRYEAIGVTTPGEALAQIVRDEIDVVIADLEMPELRGIDLLARILEHRPQQVVLLMTAFGGIEQAVEAVRAGASDFIAKPFATAMLIASIERALRDRALRRELLCLRKRVRPPEHVDLVAASSAMQHVLELARRASRSNANVLLTGDPGVGKTALARWIHAIGPRGGGPILPITCATLHEAELLRADTLLAEAAGGTVVFEEICDLSLEAQAALVALLDNRPGTRVIATTHHAVEHAIRTGALRTDLYYALGVIRIHIAPLRERTEDIRALVAALIARSPAQLAIEDAALDWLDRAEWPGNVRELASVIERAVALCDGGTITVADVAGVDRSARSLALVSPNGDAPRLGEPVLSLAEVELGYIRRVFAQTGENLSHTARVLGIDRRTLCRKLGIA